MSVQPYLVAIEPTKYHKLSGKKKRMIDFLKSSDFDGYNVLAVGKAWYATYCVLSLSFPDDEIMEQPILGGDPLEIKIGDSNYLNVRYMPNSLVRAVSKELDNILFDKLMSLDQVEKANPQFKWDEIPVLTELESELDSKKLNWEIRTIVHQLRDFYSRCATSGQALLLFFR